MTLFDTLPAELVLKIAAYCPSMHSRLALARTCRAAHTLLLSEPDYAAYAEGCLTLTCRALRSAALSECTTKRAKLGRVRSLHAVEPSVLDGDGDSDYESEQDNQEDLARPPLLTSTSSPDRRDSACVLEPESIAQEPGVPTLVSQHSKHPNGRSIPLATWPRPILHATFAATPCLTSLNLSRTSLTSSALHILLPLVPGISHLSIAQCPGITASAARTLAAHPTPFLSLDVSWTRVHGAVAAMLSAGVLDRVRSLRLAGLIGVPGELLVARVGSTICELDLGYSAGIAARDLIELAKRVKESRTRGRGKIKVIVDRCMSGGIVDARVVQQVHACGAGLVELSGYEPLVREGSSPIAPAANRTSSWRLMKAGGSRARTEAVFAAPKMAVAVYMTRRGGVATGLASPAV